MHNISHKNIYTKSQKYAENEKTSLLKGIVSPDGGFSSWVDQIKSLLFIGQLMVC